jgi:UV DNA damage endonuclease
MLPENFRLGYACINMHLREKGIFMSRTARLATVKSHGIEYIKELGMKNAIDLLEILKWNKANDIYFFRISSEFFPYASHAEYGYSLDYVDNKLKEIGRYIKDNKMRITMHPAQFNILSTSNANIVKNTFRDLNHHADILNRMQLDDNSVMIIHGGGIYNDKKKALARLEKNILKLPIKTRNRLVLENCEMAYTVQDLLPVCEKISIPLVIDFHHDALNPSELPVENYFDRVYKIWDARKIKPKVHVSNSIPGTKPTDSITIKRKHSDYIYYMHAALISLKIPIDVMLECKMKEKALLRYKKNKLTLST